MGFFDTLGKIGKYAYAEMEKQVANNEKMARQKLRMLSDSQLLKCRPSTTLGNKVLREELESRGIIDQYNF